LWFVVCGLWFVVCGLWFVVCGLWFVVGGWWLVVGGFWFLVSGLWFVVCGLWSRRNSNIELVWMQTTFSSSAFGCLLFVQPLNLQSFETSETPAYRQAGLKPL